MSGQGVLALYTITIFLGALLLFLVQPMAAKAVLPVLGGAPAVWNTCMLFFQAALLGGYAYAHGLLRLKRTWAGVGLHAVLAAGALLALPLGIREIGAGWSTSEPVWWLVATLTLSVGAPFLVLSATGPLVQGWFARLGYRASGDPYFLYAASNAGSLLALLAYPLALEPVLGLGRQERAWSWAYAAFGVLVVACGVAAARRGVAPPVGARGRPGDARIVEAPSWRSRLAWVALAFIPSSLMLGVTQHISTDIAPVPMLWVIPLAIYLLSFILVFGRRGWGAGRGWSVLLTVLAVALGVAFLRNAMQPVGLLIALHLATLLAAAMVCHGRLASMRPAPERLTEYYLLIAAGGVFGGLFNAVLAPAVFAWVAEYPLVLALACAARVPRRRRAESADAPPASETRLAGASKRRDKAPADPGANVRSWRQEWARAWRLVWIGRGEVMGRILDVLWPLWIPVLYLWITRRFAYLAVGIANTVGFEYSPARAEFLGEMLPLYLSVGVSALLCYLFNRRNLRFVAGLCLLFASGYYLRPLNSDTLLRERTFFGVYRVDGYRVIVEHGKPEEVDEYHSLSHGTTQHGLQNMAPEKRGIPLTYYHPDGPIGQLFKAMGDDPRLGEVGLVGLGTGAMAAYGERGREFTFYEIDPAVARIARDPGLFTYLSESRARVEVKVGDGRLLLAAEPDGKFGLLVLDAFSSDAIPIHLLTVEAARGYLAKLRPDGIMAFHVSNRHLDLVPVLAAVAGELGLSGLWQEYIVLPEEEGGGKFSSAWVVLGRGEALATISGSGRWAPLRGEDGFRPWTDDYSNIWSIFRWR